MTPSLDKERTIMADERTLLAYIRTALNFFIFALVTQKLYLESVLATTIFIISSVFGILLLVIGILRYFSYKKEVE